MDLREQKESKVPVSWFYLLSFIFYNNTNLLVVYWYPGEHELFSSKTFFQHNFAPTKKKRIVTGTCNNCVTYVTYNREKLYLSTL